MRPTIRIAGLLMGAGLLAACGSSAGGRSAPEVANGAPFALEGPAEKTDYVELPPSYRFAPEIAEVDPGTTVTWENTDNFPHNVHLLDGSDLTRDLPIGSRATIAFREPGTYYYECSFHPDQMRGKVIVGAG